MTPAVVKVNGHVDAGVRTGIGRSGGKLEGWSCINCRTSLHVSGAVNGAAIVSNRASGTFNVQMSPLAIHNDEEGTGLGRMSLDKEFAGDLVATSKGEMLTAMTGVNGSAGYVAMERVTGTLAGRSGSFILKHDGTMTRGVPSLSVRVVPDSATGELEGLAGEMSIDVMGGRHSYVLNYTLP